MLKKMMLMAMLAMPLALAACKTTVDGKNDKIIIDHDGYNGHPHDGGFCPPGQAKKGNC